MHLRPEDVGLRVAAALLLHKKEITVGDIRAMPFFSNADQVKCAVEYLMQNFNVRRYSRQVATYPMLEWEEVISLR